MMQLLAEASGFALGMLGLFAIALTVLIGAVTNAILQDVGFGAILNGIISMVGIIFGIFIEMKFFANI